MQSLTRASLPNLTLYNILLLLLHTMCAVQNVCYYDKPFTSILLLRRFLRTEFYFYYHIIIVYFKIHIILKLFSLLGFMTIVLNSKKSYMVSNIIPKL